jgi:hypothetical protein
MVALVFPSIKGYILARGTVPVPLYVLFKFVKIYSNCVSHSGCKNIKCIDKSSIPFDILISFSRPSRVQWTHSRTWAPSWTWSSWTLRSRARDSWSPAPAPTRRAASGHTQPIYPTGRHILLEDGFTHISSYTRQFRAVDRLVLRQKRQG